MKRMLSLLAVMSLVGTMAAQATTIAITEFINDPDSLSDSDGEWLELFNYGPASVDLLDYTITDDGSNSVTLPSITLASGGFAVLAVNKPAMETEWFGAANADVYDVDIASLGNSDDELVLSDASSTEVWRIAWDNDEVGGESTYLTGNDFSIDDYGSDGSPLIVRNGNDGVAGSPLGYETQSATSEALAFSSTGGDVGSPLRGAYTAIPEPSSAALLGISLLGLLGLRRRR